MRKLIGSDQVIERAYEELNQFNWTEEELLTYEQEIKRIMDNRAAEDYRIAQMQRMEQMLEQVKTKAAQVEVTLTEAKAKVEEAEAKVEEAEAKVETAKASSKIEIAKKMLVKNYLISDISEITGLSIDEIEKLAS